MSVICTALAWFGRCSFVAFLPCCFPQAGTDLFQWSTQHLTGATFIPCPALRSTARQPTDWRVRPLRVTPVSTHALPAADCVLTSYPSHFIPGRVISNVEHAAHWWQPCGAFRTTAPLGAVSLYMSSESEDFPPPMTPTAPNGAAEPARGTPLWSPGEDESEDHPMLSTPSALNGLTTPVSGTPLWSPGDDESEESMPPPPPPPPPKRTTPQVMTQPTIDTSARGTPVGGLLSRALRREHYTPAILRAVEPVLDPVRSNTTTNNDNLDTTEVMTTQPGVATTALIEAPPNTTPAASPASDELSQVNWVDHEAFHFNPEAHCIPTVPSASRHPEGMQYGPTRRSSRACAKMLVRAGHRCPACFCLISLCSCRRERLILCSHSEPSDHTASSYRGNVHISLCVSEAAALSFHFRSVPLLIGCTRTFARNPNSVPPYWQHPHPGQWQVLYRSYSRKQRRLCRASKRRPLPSGVAQSVLRLVYNWLHTRSLLATMNPHRPGGGPRQHYRPDGSRCRTAGELAKRAARAAARAAAAAADADGGGAAKPAGPVAAKDGTSAGALVPTAPAGEPSASASTSASASASASSSAAAPGSTHSAYPSRVRHPPPSIAAGPKPSGTGQRTWMPALPTLKVKAPPPHLHQAGPTETEPLASSQAPPPKRTTEAATLATDANDGQEKPVTEQTLLPTAPSGEPSRPTASQLPPEPPAPRRSKRSRTQPPRPIPTAEYAKMKWSQVNALESMHGDIRETEVATMLNLFQQAGHYSSQHGPFHDLRDSLQRDQVRGPNGEPLPLPPVGNWILALGISLLSFDTPAGHELLSRITNSQTAGDLIEAWALQLWNRGHQSLCAQLSGYFLLLHNLLADVPPRVYSALGQEWRISWIEFLAVMRAWIGDPPAPTMLAITQVPEKEAEQSRSGKLTETLRARSHSPGTGPLLGSRASFLDGVRDACIIPSILLPYTFPAFQVGSALPLSLQDQSECAYMLARISLQVLLLVGLLPLSLIRCLHRTLDHSTLVHCTPPLVHHR